MSKLQELIEKSGIFFEYESDATKLANVMKEYAEYCMNELKNELFYGPYNINDFYGDNKKEIEIYIQNFKHG